MTDRLKGCYVVFERDIRDDDAEPILAAIRQLRGVAEVAADEVHPDDVNARTRVRLELEQKLYEALKR